MEGREGKRIELSLERKEKEWKLIQKLNSIIGIRNVLKVLIRIKLITSNYEYFTIQPN